jgi:hypothetical protein
MVVYDDVDLLVAMFDSGVNLESETFGEYRSSGRRHRLSARWRPGRFCSSCRLLRGEIRTDAAPRSNSRLGLEVVRMIEAVDASLEANGARVSLGETLVA